MVPGPTDQESMMKNMGGAAASGMDSGQMKEQMKRRWGDKRDVGPVGWHFSGQEFMQGLAQGQAMLKATQLLISVRDMEILCLATRSTIGRSVVSNLDSNKHIAGITL